MILQLVDYGEYKIIELHTLASQLKDLIIKCIEKLERLRI